MGRFSDKTYFSCVFMLEFILKHGLGVVYGLIINNYWQKVCILKKIVNVGRVAPEKIIAKIRDGFPKKCRQKTSLILGFNCSAYEMTMYWKIKSTILSKMSSYF